MNSDTSLIENNLTSKTNCIPKFLRFKFLEQKNQINTYNRFQKLPNGLRGNEILIKSSGPLVPNFNSGF